MLTGEVDQCARGWRGVAGEYQVLTDRDWSLVTANWTGAIIRNFYYFRPGPGHYIHH